MSYTVNGEDSPPFSIGIYGSPDGLQPATLLQTYEVSDPALLGGGGQTYTATFAADLSGFASSLYLIAKLMPTMKFTRRPRRTMFRPLSAACSSRATERSTCWGTSAYLVDDHVTITQDAATGDVTVDVTDAGANPVDNQTFAGSRPSPWQRRVAAIRSSSIPA